MDFTLSGYKKLISTLQSQGFLFQNFEEYIQNPKEKVVILRHDVDRKPGNALRMAKLEANLGVKSTYFFRTVLYTFNPKIITQIGEMGHEVGYHYENLSEINCLAQRRKGAKVKKQSLTVARRSQRGMNGMNGWNEKHRGRRAEGGCREGKGGRSKEEWFELAIEDFERNLEKFRKLYPVKTICMHGSPLSRYDNKELWEKYDYRDFGIIAEPYFDLDFDRLLYLTDTGRRWDGWRVSIRDKMAQQTEWISRGLVFRTTWDIIRAANDGKLPDQIMMTFHPQRWTDNPVEWMKELVWQNAKNVVKRIIVRRLHR